MKKVLLSLLAICFAFAANAQEVCGYTAKAYQGTWTGLTGATLVNTEPIDMTLNNPTMTYNEKCYGVDAAGKVVSGTALEGVSGFPIGFEFEYLGKKYTQFGVCANGYITLGEEGQTMDFESSSSYWFKPNFSDKIFAKNVIGLYSSYLLSQTVSETNAYGEKDAFEILYKNVGNELVVEFKNAVTTATSNLYSTSQKDQLTDIYNETKCTVWSSQLHICQNGKIYWVVKGLAEGGTSSNRGNTMMAVADDGGNYVTFMSGTDFLQNPTAKIMSGSTSKIQANVPDGWTVELVAPQPVQAPKAQATLTYAANANYKGAYLNMTTKCDGADKVLLLRTDGVEPTALPVDGKIYAEGDAIGNATVLAVEAKSSLQAFLTETTSYFQAFAYNSYGTEGPKYNTTDAPVVAKAGFDVNSTPATLEVTGKTNNSITVKVTPNEKGDEVYVVMNENADWDGYTNRALMGEVKIGMQAGTVLKDADGNDCGTLVYVGKAGSFTVNNLDEGKYYYFVGLNNDGFGNLTLSTHDWSATAFDYTNYTLPIVYDLTNAARNCVPFGWTATPYEEGEPQLSFSLPINNNIASQKASGPTDKSIPLIQCTNRGGGTYTLTSPEFTLGANCTFSCDWKTIAWARFGTPPPYDPAMSWDEADYVKFQVVVDGIATDLVSYNYENAPEALNTADQWAKEKFDLSAYVGKKVKLQIVWNMVPPTEVYFGLENIAFTRELAEIPAGSYKITATITANEGVEVPEELQKYVNGYTTTGEIAEDGTISTDEPGFVLNGFKVVGGKVILNPAATLTYGDKEFNLGDANGNTTGYLGVTSPAENSYVLDNGTVVFLGNVVGTVTDISIVPVKFGKLPAIPANAAYSWQSPKGFVEEAGGKAVASEADAVRVNYPQAIQGVQYYTISLNGKKDLSDNKYTTVTLDQPLAEGDTIVVYAFKNKDDDSKKSGVKFFWGAEGTSAAMACGNDFPNLYNGGEPAAVKYVVPADAAGNTVFRMSRSETGTNLFIVQLYILPCDAATGINEVNAKAVKSGKFLENGKLVIVKNGAKFNVAGINE